MSSPGETEQRPPAVGEPLLPVDPVARRRSAGAIVFAAVAVALGYVTMYRPVHEALRSGEELRYSVKGVILPPVLLYLAVLMLTVDVRDGQIRQPDATGNRKLTRKGWLVLVGVVLVAAATLGGWSLLLHALGFQSVS